MMYEYYLYCCEPHNALYLAGAIYHSRYDPRYEHLKPFDAVTVVEDLERHIAGSPVQITMETFINGAFVVCSGTQAQLVRVRSGFRKAEAVLPYLLALACANGLTLADPLKPDRLLWTPLMLPQKGLFLCKERAARITDSLRGKLGDIQDIVPIASWKEYWYFSHMRRCRGCTAFAIVREKEAEPSLVETWTEEFCRILQGSMLQDEKLEFCDHSFIISSDEGEYSLAFCLEALENGSTVALHMDCAVSYDTGPEDPIPGRFTAEVMDRPDILSLRSEALAMFPESAENSPIFRRMGLKRMLTKYPNPADRLAASIAIEKKLRIFGGELQYDNITRSERSMIVLHEMLYRSMREEDESCDAMIMDESLFGLLYHPILQCFPGGIEYYSFLNLIGPMQCRIVTESLKNLAWYTENDPDSPALDDYLRETWIYGIGTVEEWPEYREDQDSLDSKRAFLKLHRVKFCSFLSIMIDWFDVEELYGTQDWGINICGL